jgi:hypothetical protein
VALDPDTQPKECLTLLIAAGLLILRPDISGPTEAFDAATAFIAEAERRLGSLDPP